MTVPSLLAKSERFGRRSQSLSEHTGLVMSSGQQFVEVTGEAQLRAIGLDPLEWLPRFCRDLLIGTLLHDLGKANDHYQAMLTSPLARRQGLRHEAVSFLIARQPEIRKWLQPLCDTRSVELMLWAVAGHHRKFPPADPPDDSKPEMTIFLKHPEFFKTLRLGEERLGLGKPPEFRSDRVLRLTRINSALREFDDARDEADALMRSLSQDERRYVAALKACLICADVAGSIGRRGSQTMEDWIPQAFARRPSADELKSIVVKGIKGGKIRPFQSEVAEQSKRVVFVQAGCGSGKTSAAYLWASQQAEGKRLFFCYPTTGTSTEGYRDYLIDPSLEANLIHGRADVDMEILGFGDDEPDRDDEENKRRRGTAADDSAGALEQWSTPLVSCTVDTVLGLVQNQRRGLYSWPSIAMSAFVFDEIHAYDDHLFGALLRFLTDVRGVRCLLMTASLPESRQKMIRETLGAIGEELGGPIDGPEDLQILKRYRRLRDESPWDHVESTLAQGKKVLWVVNTVAEAMALADHPRAQPLKPILYHSRFRYEDRVKRHQRVIDDFAKANEPAFAITTQVAEMSLDLSADLLITQLAPISSLIQRLGRLNRRARPGDMSGTRSFVVTEPAQSLPYREEELTAARQWLEKLGDGELSQADLVKAWVETAPLPSDQRKACVWLDGGFVTEPRALRDGSPGIEVILFEDKERVLSEKVRPEKVRIPMPVPPKRMHWQAWDEVGFCKIPPVDQITYHPERGAEWKL